MGRIKSKTFPYANIQEEKLKMWLRRFGIHGAKIVIMYIVEARL